MERDITGLITEILQRDENGEYFLQDEEVFRRFFHPGTSSGHDIRLLIEAGGETMRGHIERGAAGQIRQRGLIRPDGTADAEGLRTWASQHASALSELPALKANLEKAIAAQENLETLVVQKRLVDEIKAGALRGPSKVITRSSFMHWLSANDEAMKRVWPEDTVARFWQIAQNLDERPGGVFGFRRAFKKAFSETVEKGLLDPGYARERMEQIRQADSDREPREGLSVAWRQNEGEGWDRLTKDDWEVMLYPERFDYMPGHAGDPLYALPIPRGHRWRRWFRKFRWVPAARLEMQLLRIRGDLRRIESELSKIAMR